MSDYTIPTVVLFTTGLTELDYALHKQAPTMKPVLGGFLVGIGLYALTELDQRLGSLFAILIVLTAFLTHGLSVFRAVNTSKKLNKGKVKA